MLEKLRELNGVGPATINKLLKAGYNTAEKLIEGGIEGLRQAGIFQPVAGVILECANANQTPASEVVEKEPVVGNSDGATTEIVAESAPIVLHPDDAAKVAEEAAIVTHEPAKTAARKGFLGAKLEAAAAANGTTLEAIREAAKANTPAPQPVVAPKVAPVKQEHMNFLDVGLETPTDLTSPVQLRSFFDKLPGGAVPESARYIRNLYPVCAMCRAAGNNKTLRIDNVHVLVVTRLDNTVNSGLFCDDHITVAQGQAKDAVERGQLKSVKVLSLREAWANLTRAYAAEIERVREERYRQERAARRTAALKAVIDELGSVTSEYWLTDEQLGGYASPLDVPIFALALADKEARELHLLPNEQEKSKFKQRWYRFFDEYGMRLISKPPKDLTQHNQLVQYLRDDARDAGQTPVYPVSLIRRFFGDDLGWRYLAISELVIDEFIHLYGETHKFQCRKGAMTYEWLARRWEVQKEVAKAAASQAFAKSAEGKALNAFLTASPDEAAADSALLAGPARK